MKIKKLIAIFIVSIIAISNCMPIVYAIDTVELSSKRYKVNNEDQTILRVEPETTLEEFKNNFYEDDKDKLNIYEDENKSKKITSGLVGTSMVLEYEKNAQKKDYEISVIGDIDGNGKMEQLELSKTIRHIIGQEGAEITGIKYNSADITGDGIVDQRDITKYIKYIVDDELDVDLPDVEPPKIIVNVENKSENSISISVSAEDTGDGLENNPVYDFYIKKSNEEEYVKVNSSRESNYEFLELLEDTEYNIKVTVADKAGNVGEVVVTEKTNVQEKDEIPPEVKITLSNVNSNSININASALDNVAMPEKTMYKYYIKQNSQYVLLEETTDNNYTFENLTQNTQYEIKVETKDLAGNVGYKEEQIKTAEVKTLTEENANYVYSVDGWTNNNVEVSIKIDEEGYQIQTSKDGTNFENTNKQEFSQNGTLYARLIDSIGQIGEITTKNIENIDKLSPFGTIEIAKTSKNVKITVTADDQEATSTNGKSKIKGYYYSIDDGENYTEIQNENVYEFSNLPQATTYKVKVKIEDNAGNIKEISENTQTEKIPNETITITDISWNIDNNLASATINTTASGYKLQYSIDRSNWLEINSGNKTIEYPLGTIIYARLSDEINESSQYASIKITDNIAPNTPTLEVISGTLGTNNWYVSDVEVRITEGLDYQSGVNGTIYALSGAMNKDATEIASGETIRITKNGETTILAYSYDNAGNISEVATLTIKRDSDKPTIDEVLTTSSKITIKATSAKAKIDGYTVTRNNTVPTEFISCNKVEQLVVEIDNNLQSKDYYVWVKDEAGNISDYRKVTMDTIPINTITISDIAWNKNTHKASATVATTAIGYMVQYSTDKENWIDITSGNKTAEYDVNTTIYARLFDGTNESLDRYESFKITDKTPPTSPTIEIIQGTEGDNNWYTSDVKVKITEGIDNQCGVNKTTYTLEGATTLEETEITSGDTIIITNNGPTVITAYTYDNVGNRSESMKLILKKDDLKPTKPKLEVISGEEGENDWYTSNVKVKITVGSDAHSEVSKLTYVLSGATIKAETEATSGETILISNDGSTAIMAYTYDNAGNVSDSTAIVINKDTQKPQSPRIELVSGTLGTDNWYTTDIEYRVIEGQDNQSGAQKVTYKLQAVDGGENKEETEIGSDETIKISTDGITLITTYTYDNAGHKSDATTLEVKKDEEEPTATISLDNTNIATREAVVANVNHEDNKSGISINNCKILFNTSSSAIGTNSELYNIRFTDTQNEIIESNDFDSTTGNYYYTKSYIKDGKYYTEFETNVEGTYYLHVLTIDNAGNRTETISEQIVVDEPVLLSSIARPGDYIKYTPQNVSYIIPANETGYVTSQLFNTSLYEGLWQVLYNDSTNGLQIISAESVGQLYLGGKVGYNNAINVLNNISKKYENSNYTIANSGRIVGSNPSNPYSDTNSYETLPFSYNNSTNSNCKVEDTKYTTDYQAMVNATSQNENGIANIGEYYWTPSRRTYMDIVKANFSMYAVTDTGEIAYRNLYSIYNYGKEYEYQYPNGVRPIVQLKDEVTQIRGQGTIDAPYTIREN